jgi:hypothetical protein
MARALLTRGADSEQRYLDRLRLGSPADFRERLTAGLVIQALRATAPALSKPTSQTTATGP